jgi:hypothetical protein
MFEKLMKTHLKMSFNEAKEFYFGQKNPEREFIDLLMLYGLENNPEVIMLFLLTK